MEIVTSVVSHHRLTTIEKRGVVNTRFTLVQDPLVALILDPVKDRTKELYASCRTLNHKLHWVAIQYFIFLRSLGII